MTFLLDTQALVWAVMSQRQLSPAAVRAIENMENEILVSAVSAWEVSTKVRIGKFPEAIPFEQNFLEDISAAGYVLLPLSVSAALRSGRFQSAHQDPFDRMIAAQALELDIPVISSDEKLDQFGVRRIW